MIGPISRRRTPVAPIVHTNPATVAPIIIMRRLLCILLAALAACQPRPRDISGADTTSPAIRDTTAGPVTLRTDATAYRPGAPMTLTLENPTAEGYTFNPCTRALERESGGRWAAVDEGGRICTMEAWLLQPRSTRSGPTSLPASLPAGRYRVVLDLVPENPAGQRVRAVSAPFTVG